MVTTNQDSFGKAQEAARPLKKMGAEVTVAGPPTLIPKYIDSLGVNVTYNVKEALQWCDVANVLRIQLERQNMPLFS